MDKKERIEWIDISKGIGIIFVVLGHCVVKTDYIHKFIFCFHMPLFFLLSGYCFHKEKYGSIKEVVYRRGTSLLIPYCYFSLVGLIVTMFIPEWRHALTIKGLLIDMYQGYPRSLHVTSIWYLVSLFVISITFYIMYLISEKLNKKCILLIEVLLSGIIGYMVYVVKELVGVSNLNEAEASTMLPGGRLPLTIDASMTALVFFAIGVWLYKKDIISEIKNKITCSVVGLLLALFVGVFLNSRVNIHGCSYGNPIFFYIAAIGGSIMVIAFSQSLSSSKWGPLQKVKKLFVFYGNHSLFMMGMQSIYIHVYVYVINCFEGTDYVLYENVPSIYGIMGFLIITFVCLPISYVIFSKIKELVIKNG